MNPFYARLIKVILVILLTLAALLASFELGKRVGYWKAGSFCGRGRGSMMGGPRGFGSFHFDAAGAIGTVTRIEQNALILTERDGSERTVVLSDATTISQNRDHLRKEDIRVGDHVTVFGRPNEQGQIEAKLIRLSR